MRRFNKILLIIIGTVSVVLGVIGMFLPLLPTTPFLLLAAWCYSRSSERFYNWLLTNRWCGEYIRNYREGNGISRQNKIAALSLLWLTMLLTMVFAVSLWWVRVILASIGVAVTVHILRIKTWQPPVDTPSASETLPQSQEPTAHPGQPLQKSHP